MRWGVAGYGDIVARRVLPALRALGEEPVFLWGRDAARAARAAREWGVTAGGSDPRRLMAGTDAVYVATPVVHHVPFAERAVAAGLPVLIEKPLAGALGASAALADGWAGAGVAYYRRLSPVVADLRRRLEGWRPERVDVRFRCAFEPGPDHPMRWRTDPAVAGGGVLADAGSHRIDLLLMLFGRPAEMRARLGRPFPAGAERVADLALEWPGLSARCVFEWGEAAPVDRMALHGGGRSLVLDPLDVYAPDANPHLPLVADFVAAVAAGRPPVCPVADAALVDDVIVAAGRSHALGGTPVRPWPR
ncbi:Gfo/Idh/MocA family oxidoreductase [Streptomyces sp. NPDC047123]|uniref:Gfo/Idh/MocA family protein n=1 Tax=Streptomyces sp. NPDC047123 TaxID=3155622 RepID=UPI003400B02E